MPSPLPESATDGLTPIAITRSCFRDKFCVPRQPGLTRHARAELIIQPPFDQEDAFRGLEAATHLWLVFRFHLALRQDWSPLVRPPRLGGNRKIGVFASRSPFRPNSLGLSVVRNEGLVRKRGQLILRIRDHDLVDGTPVFDIKPYLPFADCVPEAGLDWAATAPEPRLPVVFRPEAERALAALAAADYPDLRLLIEDILSYDPRPGFRRGQDETRIYGTHLYDLNVRFCFVQEGGRERVEVLTIC